MKRFALFVCNLIKLWMASPRLPLCESCAVEVKDFHGTGYHFCPQCGKLT